MKLWQKNKAFSVLEMIIVIAIISIGLLGLISLATQNTKIHYINKNSLIASMLAQEGLELARNNRDNNWRSGAADWSNGLIYDGTYIIDYTGSINETVNNIDDDDAKLYLDANGFYVHDSSSGNISTPFSRLITVEDYTDYIIVTSEVKWISGGNVHIYTAQTYLYNWW